jgi:hypothetical protein
MNHKIWRCTFSVSTYMSHCRIYQISFFCLKNGFVVDK